ncbi:3-oxoacyl-[acyl-carrier-protein] synthase 2 [Maioricimonas rarisocia]|uniref:3-oxoacyl-[acyl-carrier-protein] synthase 2 n=1 Tax=Maioricimonas rarisocia TaxID=2528026 RepID=A0A517Z2E8_9PLAN|nr:beta-ketoacyl-[acyl-carrier-protein] synthase family protein [Maioricimonas rarisocia]QDU36645.1 3-oxoacyl-[acyl-carrier-protein] synthase 2 [Maioricimonas rarisocia]
MTSTQEQTRNVVITGIGLLSPLGIGQEAYLAGLLEGRSGVGTVEAFNCAPSPGKIGAEIREFTEAAARKSWLKAVRKNIKVMCREIQLGVASAALALEDSALDLEAIDHQRIGVEFGANLMFTPPTSLTDPNRECMDEEANFHPEQWGEKGLGKMEPLWMLKYLPNMPACHIGILADARGPNNSLTMDEAAGNLVIREATSIIRRGAADIMIVGSTGSRIDPVDAVHAAVWKELGYDPENPAASLKPYDKNRNGQVLGEAACSLMLESEEHAKARGATIYGRILGYGASCVGSPTGEADVARAVANTLRQTLESAGVTTSDLSHINGHGVGDPKLDAQEAKGIVDALGEAGSQIPVTSFKGHIGNSRAGCGIIELAGSLLAVRDGRIPQTLNYSTPDPDCPINVVHGEPQSTSEKAFLNLNLTKVGQASAVVVAVA